MSPRFEKRGRNISGMLVPISGPILRPIPEEGSPFCHQKGRRESREFLNRCTFRFRSTPSSFVPTKKIGFGAAGHFWTFFRPFSIFFSFVSVPTNRFWGRRTFLELFRLFSRFLAVFCWGGPHTSWKQKMLSVGRWVGGALALRAQRQPYGPNDNPI